MFIGTIVDGLIAVDTAWSVNLSVPVVSRWSGHNDHEGRNEYRSQPPARGGSRIEAPVFIMGHRRVASSRTRVQFRTEIRWANIERAAQATWV